MSKSFHTPVLLDEVITGLKVKAGRRYIDATLGGGGHTRQILARGGQVLALDHDHAAIDHAQQLLTTLPKPTIAHANFTRLEEIAAKHGFTSVDGILFDLGVSSHQLNDLQRGFSFTKDAALDMRMDQQLTVTAGDLLAALSKKELTQLFTKFGDEPQAAKIATAIVTTRQQTPITTTHQLADLIKSIHHKSKHLTIHPATKVFQALRIAVNDELGNLKTALPQALNLLRPGAILAIISFHSGEDKIVKTFLKSQQIANQLSIITHKPITPSPQEINQNPRSRSAKLRLAQK